MALLCISFPTFRQGIAKLLDGKDREPCYIQDFVTIASDDEFNNEFLIRDSGNQQNRDVERPFKDGSPPRESKIFVIHQQIISAPVSANDRFNLGPLILPMRKSCCEPFTYLSFDGRTL